MICGHQPDGSPLQQPHVAFVALPDVGHRQAAGSLLGVCAVLPRGLQDQARNLCTTALGNIRELRISHDVLWQIEPARIDFQHPMSNGSVSGNCGLDRDGAMRRSLRSSSTATSTTAWERRQSRSSQPACYASAFPVPCASA